MMNEIKPRLDFEPTDKYEKAKKDLIQAMNSFCELSPYQKEKLFKEIAGAEVTDAFIRFMTMTKH